MRKVPDRRKQLLREKAIERRKKKVDDYTREWARAVAELNQKKESR